MFTFPGLVTRFNRLLNFCFVSKILGDKLTGISLLIFLCDYIASARLTSLLIYVDITSHKICTSFKTKNETFKVTY
jgi:hypothetical protein